MYGLSNFEHMAIWGVFLVAILGLLYALFLRNQNSQRKQGHG